MPCPYLYIYILVMFGAVDQYLKSRFLHTRLNDLCRYMSMSSINLSYLSIKSIYHSNQSYLIHSTPIQSIYVLQKVRSHSAKTQAQILCHGPEAVYFTPQIIGLYPNKQFVHPQPHSSIYCCVLDQSKILILMGFLRFFDPLSECL